MLEPVIGFCEDYEISLATALPPETYFDVPPLLLKGIMNTMHLESRQNVKLTQRCDDRRVIRIIVS